MVWKKAQKKNKMNTEHIIYGRLTVFVLVQCVYLWPVCGWSACIVRTHTSMYELQGMLISWTKRGERKKNVNAK